MQPCARGSLVSRLFFFDIRELFIKPIRDIINQNWAYA